MKKVKRIIQRELILWISIMIVFTILSGVTLLVVRKKILNNIQVMGEEISSQLLLKEAKRIDSYEVYLKIARKWLNDLIDRETSDSEIREWLEGYKKYMIEELKGESVEIYSVIGEKIIGARGKADTKKFNLDKTKWYGPAIKADGKIVYTDLYTDMRTGKDTFTLALKINSANDVLAIDIYPDELIQKEEENVVFDYLTKDTYFYLCDNTGKIIYMKSNVNIEREKIQGHIDNIIKEIKKGEHDLATSFIYDLKNVKRGVYYSLSKEGWISIVTIPYSVLLSEMLELYYLYLGSIGIFFVIGLVLYKRESKMNKLIDETNKTIRVLGNSYYGIYKINFEEETYVMIKGCDYIRSKVPIRGNYIQLEKRFLDILEEESIEEFKSAFSIENMKYLVKNRIRDFGGDFKRLFDNEYKWANIRILFDESLNPNEIILCFKDIDDEKKKSLEYTEILKDSLKNMKEKTEAKNIFFSSMSHDMRTPLNGIIGLSELAKNHVSKMVVENYLDKINTLSKQLLNLINSILELSKLEFNKCEITKSNFSLNEKLDDIIEIFKIEANKTNKNFVVNNNIKNFFIKGDYSKLNQILTNLLSNAFKYTKAGGTIYFTIDEIERDTVSNYSFKIEDTGCGMTKEFLQKIYDPFIRETKFGAKSVMGTGLGMAIVKSLVGQLEGEIKIESELNKGTCVNVIISMETIKKMELEKKIENIEEMSFQGKKVLVAEDNEINMEIMTEFLNMKGFEVTQAWNGREVIEKFEKSPEYFFDIILIDMQMPEMDGCEATKEIRKMTRKDSSKIPIIAVTANAFAEDITATTMAGMDSHISKPIDFIVLCKVLKKYLTNSKEDIS